MRPVLNPPPPSSVKGVRSGFALIAEAIAGAARPKPMIGVAAWAEAHRVVAAESGSPFPGPWRTDRTPYLREVMDCLSFDHPCRTVTAKKSAQSAFSEAGVNLFGSIAGANPCPMLIVLPTFDEAKKYNKIKLQPTIEATPQLDRKVREVKSRDEDSSTALFKRFRGGFAAITGANSSAGLQMISARVIIFEEVSEYPPDAGGRGDPIDQAENRSKAWRRRRPKKYLVATPGIKGACRISAAYEASDQRQLYVACPQCGARQALRFQQLQWRSETKPHGAYLVCAAHGCIIEEWSRGQMIAGGVWLKTYLDKGAEDTNPPPPWFFEAEELDRWIAARGHQAPAPGRDPGFHFWQVNSPFVALEDTVDEYLAAKDKPLKLKTFWQQTLGEAWEEKGDAPDDERLFDRREIFPARIIPPNCLYTTGAADVQGERIEWAVYAWDAAGAGWLIDRGVILGNPKDPTDACWKALAGVIEGAYEDVRGQAWPIDAFGVDTGYLTQIVYKFVRKFSPERVYALDGRDGWKLPPLGTPKKVDIDFEGKKIGAVLLWPVGTFELKSEHYVALRQTIAGPDDAGVWGKVALHFNDDVDRDYFKQLTSEFLKDRAAKRGVTIKEWTRDKTRRNEGLDVAVYARALAHHLSDALTPAEWVALAARRNAPPETAQLSLARLWIPGPGGQSVPPPPPPAAPPRGDDPAADQSRDTFIDAAEAENFFRE